MATARSPTAPPPPAWAPTRTGWEAPSATSTATGGWIGSFRPWSMCPADCRPQRQPPLPEQRRPHLHRPDRPRRRPRFRLVVGNHVPRPRQRPRPRSVCHQRLGHDASGDQSHLYQNDDGVFTDVSNAAGVTDTGKGRGLLSFDYDNDGDLDVFIVNHGAQPILYRNDGGNDERLVEDQGRREPLPTATASARSSPSTPTPMSSATRWSGRSTREAISSARTS